MQTRILKNTNFIPENLSMPEQRTTVGVIGMGKLGLCFALNLEAVGFNVKGLDIEQELVRQINQKTLRSFEPGVETMLGNAQNLTATTDAGQWLKTDLKMIFLVVATPSLPDGTYDHSQVDAVCEMLRSHGPADQRRNLVVMCTTMPGFCDQLAETMAPFNYTVSYNPEFIAQGTVVKDQQVPDQVLIGEADLEAGDAIQAIYQKLCRNSPAYCRMSRTSAEIAKIATNCFLTTKISFANSIGDLAVKAGAEPDKILAAIGSDKRIGSRYLRYGFGYGGPCFPRDNRALGKFGDMIDYEVLISKATDEVNRRHLDFQVDQYLDRYGKEEVILFETVTYKQGTTILEESQQLALAERLARVGRKVLIKDQPAVIEELKSEFGSLFQYESLG